ncbi:Uu.00g092950.m01.CDS01 [Anthostomella pinea]|uniref:Uu.00g092950.m01.CDS01 n=1 Tax=Anthostomella pinea TaxID=933095 RepID=A0AAI8VNC5_9PEZI|nr:Uu.00g092950.m01.CDS01 [Anthostomella pinea]
MAAPLTSYMLARILQLHTDTETNSSKPHRRSLEVSTENVMSLGTILSIVFAGMILAEIVFWCIYNRYWRQEWFQDPAYQALGAEAAEGALV